MYCKHCGNFLPSDSKFCQYCGTKLDIPEYTNSEPTSSQQNIKVNLDGEIKATIVPSLPIFTRLHNSLKKHSFLFILYILWCILNILLLINGEDRTGFWPHIKNVKLDWDLDYYGWSEFIIYVILLPLLIYIGHIIYSYYKIYQIYKKKHPTPKKLYYHNKDYYDRYW